MTARLARLRLLLDRWPNARWHRLAGGNHWALILMWNPRSERRQGEQP